MWHSSFYIQPTRTWKWVKSRCLWKARAGRPPNPAQPTRCTTAPSRPPRTPSCARRYPGRPPGVPPSHRQRTRPAAGPACTFPPPLSRTRGANHRGQVLWQEHPDTPLLLLIVTTRVDPERGLKITPNPPLRGSACAPPPPPGSRGAGRGGRLPANTGGHRRYEGSALCGSCWGHRLPRGAQGPEPRPRLGAVGRRVGRVAHPPPAPVPMDDHQHLPTRDHHHRQPPLPSPQPPCAALHGTAHGAPLMH